MHKIGLLASIIVAFNFSACGELKKSTQDNTPKQPEVETKVTSPIQVGAAQLEDIPSPIGWQKGSHHGEPNQYGR